MKTMTIILKILNCALIFLILIATINVVNVPANIIPIVNITTNNTIENNITITENITVVNADDELFIPKGSLRETYDYADNSCELVARTFQKEYNGYLVFIAPLKESSGAWIQERYGGHWINKIYYNNETIFVDYVNQNVYHNETELHNDMTFMMQNKFNSDDIDIKIFIAGIDAMPYSINYN